MRPVSVKFSPADGFGIEGRPGARATRGKPQEAPMKLSILSGRAHPDLADAVAAALGAAAATCRVEAFPDSELQVRVTADLQGHDVFLVQPTGPPVERHLLEALLMADAARRAGARRLTAVIPYFGYARQDRRTEAGEPIGARLVAELLATRFDHIVTVDLHNPAIEGFFGIPVENLSAVPLLAETVAALTAADTVVVAPDLGAVKLAHRYSDLLHLPVAVIHKERLGGARVRVRRVIGRIRNRTAVLVDDMISTGSTIASAAEALLSAGCRPPLKVAATHALLVGPAAERLGALPLDAVIVTDSVRPAPASELPLKIVSLADLLARTIGRLHRGETGPVPARRD
jgi:ribose-phosphate pyrophosphokinase